MTRFRTNMAALDEEEKHLSGGRGERRRVEWFKPRTGKNLIRILPPAKEGAQFYKRQGLHTIGGGMGLQNKIVCPKLTFGKACPICVKFKKVKDARGEEAAEPYAPKKRYFLNVLDMKSGDGEIYVWEAGPQLFRPIYEFIKEMDDDTMLDYEEGYNFKFERKGTGKNTRYENPMVVPKAFNLADNGYDPDEIQGKLYDLDAVPWRPKDEDLHDFLERLNDFASGGEESDEDDDGGGRRGGGRRSSEVDDEDADEDDAPPAKRGKGRRDEDDEDEEPAKPAKSAKASKKAKPARDDDGDPDDDEDEAPRGKGRRAAADEDDEEEERPRKTSRKAAPADDEEDLEIPF